jgi:hypothetical protein
MAVLSVSRKMRCFKTGQRTIPAELFDVLLGKLQLLQFRPVFIRQDQLAM